MPLDLSGGGTREVTKVQAGAGLGTECLLSRESRETAWSSSVGEEGSGVRRGLLVHGQLGPNRWNRPSPGG